ncbi:MAG: hypothetical protein ACRDAL_02295 [Plesiomonas shigelloides]
MSNHNPAPWRFGYMYNSIVCDTEIPEIRGANDVESYGGYMICESVAKRNAARIIACVNACEGISNEDLVEENVCVVRKDLYLEMIRHRGELLNLLMQATGEITEERDFPSRVYIALKEAGVEQ